MKTKTFLLGLAMFVCLSLFTGCSSLQIPGVVTVPAPSVTRLPVETLALLPIPSAAQAQPTLTPFPVSTQPASATPAPTLSATATVTPTATVTSSATASSTATVTRGPTPTALPTDTAEPLLPLTSLVPHYSFDITMDYNTKTLDVSQVIDYPNTSGERLATIVLAVQPNLISKVFELKQIRVDETTLTNYTLEGQKLTIPLPVALENQKMIRMEFGYKLSLPAIKQGDPNVIRPQIFGYTDRQVNLTDWYPMVAPYQPAQGWVLNKPWFYGEHLVYSLANFDITLRFKDAGSVPVVAASATAAKVTGGVHYELKNARDFVFAMGRQFKSTSDTVDGVTITSYFYTGSGAAGRAALDATVKAVRTYSDLFGPYPHESLSVIQGDFNDGMEFDGLYFLSNSFYNLYDNTEKNYLVMIAAHETSHQWWFGRVANDQASEPWLDESLATYCEKLFYEKNYPASVAKWWRGYRIDFYKPTGPIDGNVPGYGGFTPYTDAVYRRGALFMGDLRQQIGDDAFFAFLKDYSTQMNGRIASSSDFFRILHLHTQADITDLLSRYFANPPKW
jgi:hypothetical protein